MEKIYSPAQFASMINVTVHTLQRWDKKGILIANRTITNRRYYTESQYNELMGIKNDNKRINVIYCRVSNRSQKDDLVNQIEYLLSYSEKNNIKIDKIITDIGSGLNYKRKNWNTLIDDCCDGKIDKILIAHKDRFVRFGFNWFEIFLNSRCNVSIISLDNTEESPENELVKDLISIIHIFSCRIYGLRKYKKKILKGLGVDKDE